MRKLKQVEPRKPHKRSNNKLTLNSKRNNSNTNLPLDRPHPIKKPKNGLLKTIGLAKMTQ